LPIRSRGVDAAYAKSGVPSAADSVFAHLRLRRPIYCDFSGYTDMAIGLAMLLEFRLPNNFSRPTAPPRSSPLAPLAYHPVFLGCATISISRSRQPARRLSEIRNILVTMPGRLWHGASRTS